MLMVYPDQAGSLQGSRDVSCDILAVNDSGNGSGWQQSKQNWALLAVMGPWARMVSNDLYRAWPAQLHLCFSHSLFQCIAFSCNEELLEGFSSRWRNSFISEHAFLLFFFSSPPFFPGGRGSPEGARKAKNSENEKSLFQVLLLIGKYYHFRWWFF